MVDASASRNPKGINTKKDKEDMMPKTTIFSKLKRVGDTNIGTTDMIQLRDRLKEGQSSMAKKIYKSGIVQAVAFPPTLPCPELIVECASQLDIVTKSIIFDEGKRMLANISGASGRRSVQYTPAEGRDSNVDGSSNQVLSGQLGCLPCSTKAELVIRRQEGSHQDVKAHQVRFQIRIWRPRCASQPSHGLRSRYAV